MEYYLSKYTKEIIDLIEKDRAKGMSWNEVAQDLAEITGDKFTSESVRTGYRLHANDDEFNEGTLPETLIKQRRSQLAATSARSTLKQTLNSIITAQDILDSTAKILKDLPKITIPRVAQYKHKKVKCKMTVEALFSDLQLGKLSPDFNLDIARRRIIAYTDALILKIQQHQKLGYDVEKIVFVLLGDIIESMDKALQKGDAMSCEVDTPEQVRLAVEWIWELVLLPLYQLNIPLHVIGIPGNHDHIGPGMKMFKAGKNQLSWIIYKQLELLCKATKMDDVTFDVTEGVFTTYSFYGQTCVYEHGYGLNVGQRNLQIRLNDRIRQLKKYCTYFRMGDKHDITRFTSDTLVVNGAFFGSTVKDRGEEYSSVQGYSAPPAQMVFFHVPRTDARLTLFDSFVIQLGHVY